MLPSLSPNYDVERELGRGGMASVWLATDRRSGRRVAIKVLQPALAGAIGADRFAREVGLTAKLQHPGIVPVLDSGVLPGSDGDPPLPWYAMPFVEGESLRARMQREGQLPIDDALRITADVADALQAAHAQGIVHRDIKPENVLLAEGRVYVVDFGIAKALVDVGGDRLTSTGIAIGTPAYMSPEQASAGAVDPRSDQYALATMLYEMLVGETPYTGPTAQAIIARRFAEPARSMRTVRSAVPEQVERTVLRALERSPVDRFPDVATFARELRRTSGVARAPSRRGSRVVPILVLLVVTLVGSAVAREWRQGRFATRAGPTRDSVVVALYQRGMHSYDTRTPAGTLESITAFREAVRRDSTYAAAWTGLAKAYVRSYERAFRIPGVSSDSTLRLAVAATDRALANGRETADVWLARAIVSRQIDPTDRTIAMRAVRRAIALDSSNAVAWHYLALGLMETGDVGGALRAWRRSVTVDPTYTQGLGFLGVAHFWRHAYDSALVWTDSSIALDPNYLLGWSYVGQIETARGNLARAAAGFDAAARLAADVERVNNVAGSVIVDALAGRGEHARVVLRDVDSLAMRYDPVPVHTALFVAEAHAGVGDADGALRWLGRYSPSADLHFQLHLRCDPQFEPLARDRRFLALLLRDRPAGGCR